VRGKITLLIGWLLLAAVPAGAVELTAPVPIEFGGRLEYDLRLRRDGSSFPGNYSTGSVADRTRLMLDLKAGDGRAGMLYLKSAVPGRAGPDLIFEFEQGDYLIGRGSGRTAIQGRLFVNERRFFSAALIAPLISDDRGGSGQDNYGLRVDGNWRDRIAISGLYAGLGNDFDDAVRISYARMEYSRSFFGISTAYLHENGPETDLPDQAVIKGELSAFYKPVSLFLAVEQSGSGNGLFMPDINLFPDHFGLDNFHRIVPEDGAFFAEARWRALQLKDWGRLNLSQKYYTVGESFYGARADLAGGSIGYKSGLYFTADSSCVNGRLEYTRRERFYFENEIYEAFEASAWAGLQNGSELLLRTGIKETRGQPQPQVERNYIHGGYIHRIKNLQSGVHVKLEDMDTVYSGRKLAWDSRMNFSGNIAVFWRAIIMDDITTSRSFHARFEYRPSPRLFLAASYGWPEFGDGPFVFEDPDIGTAGRSDPVYSFYVRGDF
jgi:hypothetical protein